MVYKAPDFKSTNVKYKRVLWRIFAMIIHDNFWTQTWNSFHHFRHWALSFPTQMHQMAPYTLGYTYRSILYTLFFLRYFLMFSEFMFHRKSLRLPCHLRYHKGFVKFPMGLNVFSSQIMYGGVTYEEQVRMTQAMTISSKPERSRWFKKTRMYYKMVKEILDSI